MFGVSLPLGQVREGSERMPINMAIWIWWACLFPSCRAPQTAAGDGDEGPASD